MRAFKDGTENLSCDLILNTVDGSERLILVYKYNISDIKFVEERDKVYVLAYVKYEFLKLKITFGDDTGDTAYDYVRKKLKYSTESWANSQGFPNGEDSTEDEVRKSSHYKYIKGLIDDFMSSEMKVTLHEKVYPVLKIREGVMPLAVYSLKDNKLNYPWSHIYSRNVMSSSARDTKSNIEASINLKDVIFDCKRYAPFHKWLILKSSYPNVKIIPR